MRKELGINIEHAYLIINRVNGELPAPLNTEIQKMDVPLLGVVPANDDLAEFEFSGKPLVELGDESPVYQAIEKMMNQVLK
jgi:CO dehydrogenase nickel-insertion accessory protein CooC1